MPELHPSFMVGGIALGVSIQVFLLILMTWYLIRYRRYITTLTQDIARYKQPEQVLRLAQLTLERAADGVVWVNAAGRHVYLNDTACQMLGYTREELLARTIFDIDANVTWDMWQALWQHVQQHGCGTVESTIARQDNSRVPVEITSNYIEIGTHAYLCSFIRDLTERKRAEFERESSLALMEATVESATGGVIVTTQDKTVITYNQKFTQLWQLPADWPALPTWRDRLAVLADQVLDPEGFVNRVRELVMLPEAEGYDLIPLRDGRVIERYANPYRVGGTIAGRLWSHRDVTERVRAETELRASRARLKAIFENAAVGIALLDTSGHYIEVNRRWAEILGIPLTDIVQMNYYDTIHPDDRANGQQHLQAFITRKVTSMHFERRFIRGNGSTVWTDLSATSICNEQGNLEAILAIIADITEQKRAEEVLRASEEHYRLLAENMQDVVWTMNTEGYFTYVSPSVFQLRGYTPAEVLQQHMSQVLTPASVQLVLDSMAAGGEGTTCLELEQPCKDGSTVLTECVATALRDNTGTITGWIGVSRDITERKKVQEALLASEYRYQALALQNERLYEIERQRAQALDALHTTLTDISGELDLDILLNAILERAIGLLRATCGQLCLWDATQGDLVVAVSCHMNHDYRGARLALGEGAMGWVALSRQPLIIENYATWEGKSAVYADEGAHTVLTIPLLAGGQLVGAITIGDANIERTFAAADVQLLSLFAQQATIAIQNARLFAEAQHLATTDPLMGLHNRRHFFTLAAREFEQAVRYGRPLAAIMLDIDNFKRINDTYGHQTGDLVLQAVARQCQATLRTADVIGRYGGEEVVILLSATDGQGAVQVAERLRHTLAETAISTASEPLFITASLGVAAYESAALPNVEKLVDQADQALYVAKKTGKNRVVTWCNGKFITSVDLPAPLSGQHQPYGQAEVAEALAVNRPG